MKRLSRAEGGWPIRTRKLDGVASHSFRFTSHRSKWVFLTTEMPRQPGLVRAGRDRATRAESAEIGRNSRDGPKIAGDSL